MPEQLVLRSLSNSAKSLPEAKQTVKIQTDSVGHSPIYDLFQKVEFFTAGNIHNHLSKWKSITSDAFIIDIVKSGLKLHFTDEPAQKICHNILITKAEKQIISDKIRKLLQKEIIYPCMREEGNFMSSIFSPEKRDGSYRMILNLKQLNKHNEYEDFKMESLQSVLNIIRPNCWMASVDLKDAFYTVPIHTDHQRFLKFKWQEQCYAFRGMPNGYKEAMRVFTKLLNPPFFILRSCGYLSVVFIDDSYLHGSTFSMFEDNVNAAVDLLQSLGFTIHPEKSVLVPTQEIEFFGFVLNCVEMKIKLTNCKCGKIILKIKKLLYEGKQTI